MYGDDVILFASPAEEAQKRVLSIFGGASGLMTNLSKCSITPTYGAQETLLQIQVILPCQITEFPITYLVLGTFESQSILLAGVQTAHLDSRSTSSATAGST